MDILNLVRVYFEVFVDICFGYDFRDFVFRFILVCCVVFDKRIWHTAGVGFLSIYI